MDETQAAPVSSIVVEFTGADGMTPKLTAGSVTPAQWAMAAALVQIMTTGAWSQALQVGQQRGIVPAGPGALQAIRGGRDVLSGLRRE